MKRISIIIVSLVLALVAGLAGCHAISPLEDTAWVLESALPNVQITVFFNSAEKRFTGNAVCNTYSGSYKVEGSKLSFPEGVAITLLKCDEEAGKQEDEYIRAFSAAKSYQIEDGRLYLNCGQQVLIYVMETLEAAKSK